MNLNEDADAVLIHRLFGSEAEATRATLSPEVNRRIDEAAVEVLDGRAISALASLPEHEAEWAARQLALAIRTILSEASHALAEEVENLREQISATEQRMERLNAQKASILQRLADAEGGELVRDDWRCPGCGERDIDRLVIQDDESVACQTCGWRYRLPGDVRPE